MNTIRTARTNYFTYGTMHQGVIPSLLAILFLSITFTIYVHINYVLNLHAQKSILLSVLIYIILGTTYTRYSNKLRRPYYSLV